MVKLTSPSTLDNPKASKNMETRETLNEEEKVFLCFHFLKKGECRNLQCQIFSLLFSSSWLLVCCRKKLKNAVLTMNDMLTCLHETNIFKLTKSWKGKKIQYAFLEGLIRRLKWLQGILRLLTFLSSIKISLFIARTFIAIKTFILSVSCITIAKSFPSH